MRGAGGARVELVELSLAATDVQAMVRFYDTLFDAGLQPSEAFGTTFHRGALHGVAFVLAPNDLAGVEARQNRHQFVYAVTDLSAFLARVTEAGGTVRDSTGTVATVLDPDGNTLVVKDAGG